MTRLSQLLIMLAVIAVAGLVLAADSTKVAAPAKPAKLHDQTLCPVSGEDIDKKHFVDYDGQRVYFCCPKCPAKFKADPESFFKKAAAEGVLFESVQKVCPISGDKIDKKAYTDYDGRRIYFCCKKCRSTFAADPMKFLKRMEMPPDSVKYDEM